MSATQLKTEGIITQVLPYRNYDAILTLFSPHEGIIKFFQKGAFSPKGRNTGLASPLSVVEIAYTRGRGELNPCSELHVVDHHLGLRSHLGHLETACSLLQAITQTQEPGRGAPDLYRLLLMYLRKLPTAPERSALLASFRLKLLRYEGVFGFLSHCCTCGCELTDAWVCLGETFCKEHTPPEALYFPREERSVVEVLAFSRDLHQIASTPTTGVLATKIERLFMTI